MTTLTMEKPTHVLPAITQDDFREHLNLLSLREHLFKKPRATFGSLAGHMKGEFANDFFQDLKDIRLWGEPSSELDFYKDEDTWDEPENELTRAMNRSLEKNSENTSLPISLARLQTRSIRDNK